MSSTIVYHFKQRVYANLLTLFCILLILNATGCFSASPSNHLDDCYFDSQLSSPCLFTIFNQSASVKIIGQRKTNGELLLESAFVQFDNIKQKLTISDDTIMIPGDKGVIVFDDINFDGIPDLGVSTSFGIANHYFDYWVFNSAEKRFTKVGNYLRFILHPEKKLLSYSVKISAAEYEEQYFQWLDDSLKEIKERQ